jgi:hypothetical protein
MPSLFGPPRLLALEAPQGQYDLLIGGNVVEPREAMRLAAGAELALDRSHNAPTTTP